MILKLNLKLKLKELKKSKKSLSHQISHNKFNQDHKLSPDLDTYQLDKGLVHNKCKEVVVK